MADEIYKKTYEFSKNIVLMYKHLTIKSREYVLSKQFLRSGTSIGANVSEAKYAQSRKDFLNKMRISLKEASETSYWIRLLIDSEYIDKKSGHLLLSDCKEIIYILTAIINTTEKNSL